MSEPSKPTQRTFGLTGLLELIAGIGLVLALVTQLGWLGWVMAVGGIGVLWVTHHIIVAKQEGQARLTLIELLVLGAIVAMGASLLLPAVAKVRESDRRAWCHNTLLNIIQAFRAYHDEHGHFPPPLLADASGKPMHSWRVLILPYLGQSGLYAQYDFSEPWNGPNNSKLAVAGASIYGCPSHAVASPGLSSYFCVVGPGRTKAGKTHQELADFADGPTIMLIESHAPQINWLEPRDLTVEDLVTGKHPAVAPGSFLIHHGGGDGRAWRGHPCFHCATQVGTVHAIRADIDKDSLRALLTIDGGEAVDLEAFSGYARLWPGVGILLAAEVVFLIFAIARRVRIARRTPREVRLG
jgi:hypothetical protein